MRVIVVPGAFTAASAFQVMAERLTTAGHDVTVVDLPARSSRLPQVLGGGLGRIDAMLDETIDEIAVDADDLVLVGHSLGGLACLRATQRRSPGPSPREGGRTPAALALLTPAPPGGLARELLQLIGRDPVSALKFAALAVTSKTPPVADAIPPQGLFTDQVTDDELRASMAHRRDESWRLLAQLVLGSRDRVEPLGIPTLVVGGTEDGLVPERTCADLAERLGARYEVLPVGHAFAEEAAGDVVTDVLVDWLATVPDA